MDFRNNFIIKIEKWATIFFFSASIFVVSLLMQALILAWLSQFKIIYLLFSIFISSIISIIFSYFTKKDINVLPRLSIYVLMIILLICLIGIFFPHETFGGRDEGSYSNIAVMLSKNNNLLFPSYLRTVIENQIGEDTQKVVTITTPAYYVWLAIQNVLFGLQWMLRSNIILVSLGLCSLFLVSFLLSNKKSLGFITIILYTSSMPFLWFFRETMSENLAFFLLWTSIAFLFIFFKTKRLIYLIALMLGTWIFSFTRLEGVLIQFTIFLVFSTILLITKIFPLKKKLLIILIYFIVIISFVLISNPFSNNSNLRANITHVSTLLKKSISPNLITQTQTQNNGTISKNITLQDRFPIFFILMLAKYNLVLILFSIFLISPLIVFDKKISRDNKIYFIGLLIILSPEFYKFINLSVSLDQPWLYRRYVYALLPMGYLSFSILFNKLMSRKLLIFFIAIFFIINIVLSSKIITLKNNWSMTEKIEKLTKNISLNDFVILKEWTILNNYYPNAYLIYHKEIRTLFRYLIDDRLWLPREKKYNGVLYNKLFLLSDKDPDSFKDFKLLKIDSVEIEYKQLEPNCKQSFVINQLESKVSNMIYLPFQYVVSFCSKTDNDILEVKKEIFLYELINKK